MGIDDNTLNPVWRDVISVLMRECPGFRLQDDPDSGASGVRLAETGGGGRCRRSPNQELGFGFCRAGVVRSEDKGWPYKGEIRLPVAVEVVLVRELLCSSPKPGRASSLAPSALHGTCEVLGPG
jgi:hypothetical protein